MHRWILILITIAIAVIAAVILILVPPLNQIPIGEYGDAPDGGPTGYPNAVLVGGFRPAQTGSFPTLYANNGAHTLDVNSAVLGSTASQEHDANDPNDPDGVPNLTNSDSDDGITNFVIVLTSIPPPTTISLNVESQTAGTFYLNAAVDLNMDGKWGGTGAGGESEWIVQNQKVDLIQGMNSITSEKFGYSSGNRIPDPAWLRVAITDEKINSTNWDGTGEFSSGEIEDHLVEFPELKKVPMPVIDCNGPYNFNGQNMIPVDCVITNISPYGGNINWQLTQQTNNVLINNAVVFPAPPGVINLAPSGNPGDQACTPGIIGGCNAGAIPLPALVATKIPPLPSTWIAKAWVKDPDAIISPTGVEFGWRDSQTTITFEDKLPEEMFVGMFDAMLEDSVLTGEILVISSNETPVSNAKVSVNLYLDDKMIDEKTISTNEQGLATYVNEVEPAEKYILEITKITSDDFSYNSDKNSKSKITLSNN